MQNSVIYVDIKHGTTFLAIWANYRNPPQWDKKLKILDVACGMSYLYYKTFLDICMKFVFIFFFVPNVRTYNFWDSLIRPAKFGGF